jgi:hypothetical protein
VILAVPWRGKLANIAGRRDYTQALRFLGGIRPRDRRFPAVALASDVQQVRMSDPRDDATGVM